MKNIPVTITDHDLQLALQTVTKCVANKLISSTSARRTFVALHVVQYNRNEALDLKKFVTVH